MFSILSHYVLKILDLVSQLHIGDKPLPAIMMTEICHLYAATLGF